MHQTRIRPDRESRLLDQRNRLAQRSTPGKIDQARAGQGARLVGLVLVACGSQQNDIKAVLALQMFGTLSDLGRKPLFAWPARSGEKYREAAAAFAQIALDRRLFFRREMKIPLQRRALDAEKIGEL